MYLADYHTHSRISPDARHSMEEMANAAIAAGLDEICFTDHVEPVVWETTQLCPPYDWAPLTEEFRKEKTAVGGKIQMRLGIELGDAPLGEAWCEDALSRAPEELDFVIGSIHMLSEACGDIDLYYFDPKTEDEARAGIADYLKRVRRLAQWGKFSVLGHLTLPLRYLNQLRGFQLTFDGFEDEVEEIFRLLIQNGCGIEVNTNRGNTPLPDEKWLRMYRRLGGEIVTLGTDAHTPEYVGCAVKNCQEMLRRCGFTRFCTFERMQPIWHEL